MSNLYKIMVDDVNGSIIWVRANSIKDVSEAYKGVAIDSIARVRKPAGVVVDVDLTVKDRDPSVTEEDAEMIRRVKEILHGSNPDPFFASSYYKVNAVRAHRWLTNAPLADSIRWVEKFMPEECYGCADWVQPALIIQKSWFGMPIHPTDEYVPTGLPMSDTLKAASALRDRYNSVVSGHPELKDAVDWLMDQASQINR